MWMGWWKWLHTPARSHDLHNIYAIQNPFPQGVPAASRRPFKRDRKLHEMNLGMAHGDWNADRGSSPVWTERAIALSIFLFLLAQTLLLEGAGAVPAQYRIEIWAVTLALAGLATQGWLVRRLLPAHTDMLLLML